MANIRAAASGDFSATGTWVGGVVPGSGDVAFANTFTVTIRDTRTVQAISNASGTSITAGGTFSLLNGCNLTCTNANGVVQGTVGSVISVVSLTTGQTATVSSNMVNNSDGNAITITSAGTVNWTGNLTQTNTGRLIESTGSSSTIFNLTGSVTSGFSPFPPLNMLGSVTLTVVGSLTVGTSGSTCLLIGSSLNTATITGPVTGSPNSSNPCIANSGGTLTVNGTCQSGAGPAIGAGSATQITRLSGPFLLGASGNLAPVTALAWRWAPTQIPTYMEVPTSSGSTKRNMYTADNMPSGGYPVAANVRQSTVYGPSSEFTGTLAVPSPSAVSLGVATDNTTGTAILTAASVRTAVGLASANLDAQFDAIPTAPENASAVRTNLTPELDRIQNCSTVDTTAQTVQNAVSS